MNRSMRFRDDNLDAHYECRQPVFRSLGTDITQPGWHNWQTNRAANANDTSLAVGWEGALRAQTRVP